MGFRTKSHTPTCCTWVSLLASCNGHQRDDSMMRQSGTLALSHSLLLHDNHTSRLWPSRPTYQCHHLPDSFQKPVHVELQGTADRDAVRPPSDLINFLHAAHINLQDRNAQMPDAQQLLQGRDMADSGLTSSLQLLCRLSTTFSAHATIMQ